MSPMTPISSLSHRQRQETTTPLWDLFRRYRYVASDPRFSLDVSRVRFGSDTLTRASRLVGCAFDAIERLEAGAIANPTENRMVGHYWLRAPALAPTSEIASAIEDAVASVLEFAGRVRNREVMGADGAFEHVVHVGVGGSTVGPQLLCAACEEPSGSVQVHFLDNADPDGVNRLLESLAGALGRTLVSVVSKSGVTPATRQLLHALEESFRQHGLDFGRHAVATTMPNSELDGRAREWLARFPVWEWVGGRTSVTSAVGLLPGALAGIDVTALLSGAAGMDRLTRVRDPLANPAALLAITWHFLGDGHGHKRMVVLPYSDRLSLFARYVQQLVMESVGKERDRDGAIVHQGLTVYGHKGSADQHSYLQQLRDGTPDFFVTFVQVDHARRGNPSGITAVDPLGDHLFGSLEATRDALYERGRDSVTIGVPEVSPGSLGALIALYERAVGIYAELINVNAYDQPGVVKAAAAPIIELQRDAVAYLLAAAGPLTAEELAAAIGQPERVETVYKLLERLASDPGRGIKAEEGDAPFQERFSAVAAPVEP